MKILKNVYLGKFYIDYLFEDAPANTDDYIDGNFTETTVLVNELDETDYYELGSFMRENTVIEGIGEIHGICGETNNSSIVLQFDEDDCEVVKLWRIY